MSEKKLIKDDVLSYLRKHERKELLRFITCGSVDDGKSTLIGRLLYEAKMIFKDHLMAIKAEAKYKRTEDEIDFSLLIDGLQAEREQGITIDVAYRYFSTEKRKFIIADTPGHEQYTRNMVTGASNTDLAIILIDSRNGVLTQTKRHTFLACLLGIKNIIVAVNKMDLVGYSSEVFERIKSDYDRFFNSLFAKKYLPFLNSSGEGFTRKNFHLAFLPISALKGDNVVKKTAKMPWYTGKTLLEYLNTIKINNSSKDQHKHNLLPFRFPVQYVNRPDFNFRGYCGTVVSGSVSVGDEIVNLPSGIKTKVKEIILPVFIETTDGRKNNLEIGKAAKVFSSQAATIITREEVDISRGDLIVKSGEIPELSDSLDTFVVWLNEQPLKLGKNYNIKRATTDLSGYVDEIYYRININTLEKEQAAQLKVNEVGFCRVVLSRKIGFDNYWQNRFTGGLIFIDRITNNTVGAGLILKKGQSKYITWHKHRVGKGERGKIKGHKPCTIWLTGLSGAGKSTIANRLEQELNKRGFHTYLLDGDNIRHGLNKDLNFSNKDRKENIRRVSEVAKLFVDAGLIVLTAFISPFEEDRNYARSLVDENEFIEVFVDTPLETCRKRDTKGLYEKARKGEIKEFTGINSPYEPPKAPEVHIQTERLTVDESVEKILNYLLEKGVIS